MIAVMPTRRQMMLALIHKHLVAEVRSPVGEAGGCFIRKAGRAIIPRKSNSAKQIASQNIATPVRVRNEGPLNSSVLAAVHVPQNTKAPRTDLRQSVPLFRRIM